MADLIKIYAEVTAEQRQHAKTEKLAAEFMRLLPDTLWPHHIQKDPHRFHTLIDTHMGRIPSLDTSGSTGRFFSQKMNREVSYRSQLEMQMLQRLEAADGVAWYQERPFSVTENAYGAKRTYRPDILFVLKDGRGGLAEVTPLPHMALRENLIRYETLRIFCVKNGLGLLITDGRRTFQHLRRHAVPLAFQQALLEALAQSSTKSISWKEYQTIRDHYAASWMDFLAVVLAHRLIWSLRPFILKPSDP